MKGEQNPLFIIAKCKKCGNDRKFLVNTIREKERICGECWDWNSKV